LPTQTATIGYWDDVAYDYINDSNNNRYIDTPNITLSYPNASSEINHTLTDNVKYSPNITVRKDDGSASDSYVIQTDTSYTRTYYINNSGTTNITACNLSLTNRTSDSTSLSSYASFNISNFNVVSSTIKYFTMTLTNVPASSLIYYEKLVATCSEANASMSIDVSCSEKPSGNGGGGAGGEEYPTAGDFKVFPSERIIGTAYPETLIQPPFVVSIYNGNATMKFYLTFSEELKPYCELIEYPENPIPPGGYTKFVFECYAPNGTVEGHINIKTSGQAFEKAIPTTLIGGYDIFTQFNAFFIMLIGGNIFEAFTMNFIIFGWQIPSWTLSLLGIVVLILIFGRGTVV
jgi:hypothetical protein